MEKDLVCGMYFVSTEGCKVVRLNNKNYYFCCDICKEEFEQNTRKYIEGDKSIVKSDKSATDWERDPVCGERINIKEAKGITLYKNASYYFCCKICKKLFDTDPSAYADKEEGYFDPSNPNDLLKFVTRIL